MKAILFVGHGSKDPEGNEEIAIFVKGIQEQIDVPIVETCYLEFCQPDVDEGIENCIRQGADEVVLIPMMLLAAGHSKMHIPGAMDRGKEKFPHVKFTYGRPIAFHEEVFSILDARMAEVGFDRDELSRRPEETALLLVGRGSSDPDANSDLFKLSRLLWERLPVKWVETCFIGVTTPTVEEGIQRCIALGAKRIVILPYLLFTGVLMKRIQGWLDGFRAQNSGIEMAMTDYFGFHPGLKKVFLDRVEEALAGEAKMNCDRCKYRLALAEEEGHHHHHHHDHHHGHGHHHHDHHHGHGHHHHHNHEEEVHP